MTILSSLHNRYISLSPSNTSNLSTKLSFQILILQIFYYFTAFIIFFITSILLGWNESTLKLIFSWEEISLENSFGLTLILLWLINSLISVLIITLIISRSKLVWDFALTIHLLNLIIISLINGFPWNFYWWILELITVVLVIILGTYTTRWIELRDTFFDTDIEMGSK
ncbi:Sys1 protein [Pichia kluyveri]|uniref:Sys1 protein n=1 Tax=Pichia kluyveri TaxID=36015 RepID=A0AAV5R543_PICKL|nr:Sys1 protein [Pichia kluyveri]